MYPLNRNLHSSARLSLQHLIWNVRLGFLLHPAVALSSFRATCIADIGTGTAIWPLELSQHLPLTTGITGYDISSLQFPAKEHLPGNVRLEVFDALSGAMPTSLVHAFDVVHLRALVLAVKSGDPSVLISRLAKMLKPGGFLQWDEIDVGAYRSQSSDAVVPAKASEQFIGYFLQYMRSLTLDSDWVSHLPTHLTPQGFEIIEWTKLQDHGATCKLETDDHLMVLEDQLPNIAVFLAEKAGRPCVEARQDLERLFRAVVRETERGVSLRMDWYCCLARKC